jgi:hypothetical protein
MNESGVSFGIARRLGLIAALLAALAAGNSHGASLDLHEYSTAPTWEGSDASVTRADVASTNHRAAEVALAEVRTTRSILETTRELLVAPGFDEFLDHVGLALDAYEASPRKPEHLTVLATSLAVARASLQGRATSLPHWAAVARSAGATSTRYVRVPDRFVETFTVARETAPSSQDFAATFEFDHIAGV